MKSERRRSQVGYCLLRRMIPMSIVSLMAVITYMILTVQMTHGEIETLIIPLRLIFTYQMDLLKVKDEDSSHLSTSDGFLRSNVLKTIHKYEKASFLQKQTKVEVAFLDDDECRKSIETAKSQLVAYFEKEQVGKYKADICRIAELYLRGGYYFDVDLEVIEPLIFLANTNNYEKDDDRAVVEFATVLETGDFGGAGFFQAFTAGSKGHPIFAYALEEMLQFYVAAKKRDSVVNLGPVTLRAAYNKYVAEMKMESGSTSSGRSISSLLLLHEDKLEGDLKRRYSPQYVTPQRPVHDAPGWGCNYVVHDDNRPYFFSRAVGAKRTNAHGAGCW